MTLRIPRAALYILAAGLVVGIGVAAYVILKEPAKDCVTSTGSAVSCDAEGSLTPAEYDQQQAEEVAAEKAAALEAKCRQQTGDLMKSLQELDSRLSVGLAYADYSTQVGNTRVAYDRIPIGSLSPKCVTDVAIHLEDAMNAYVKADNTWNNCISDLNCDNDSIDPELQERWSEASGLIAKAESGLSELGEPAKVSVAPTEDAEASTTSSTTTDETSDETSSSDDEGFVPSTDDCVSPSTGETVDCDYPGAVDRTVYEEHADN